MTTPSDDEVDRLLGLVEEGPEPDQAELGDERLAALRRGQLSEEESTELARELGRSASARALARYQAEPIDEELRSWAKDQLPRSRLRVWATIGLALAAAIALFFLIPRPAMRPLYEVDVLGGVSTLRSNTSTTSRRFAPGSIVELRGRPKDTAAEGSPVLFVARAGRPRSRAENIEIDVAPNGRFRIRAPAESLFTAGPGEYRLYVVIGSAELEINVTAVPAAGEEPR